MWKGGIGDGECGNWMWVMGTAGEVEVATEAVGGAVGRVPNPGMPPGQADGCGEEGPAEDGPAAWAQESGGVGTGPLPRSGNSEGETPPAEVVGGAGSTLLNPSMPYGKTDGCGAEGPADDGPAACAQGNGGVGPAPTPRGGNGDGGGPRRRCGPRRRRAVRKIGSFGAAIRRLQW